MHLNAQREDMQKQTSNIHKCVYYVHHWQQRLFVQCARVCLYFSKQNALFLHILHLICSYLDMQKYAENMHQH